MSMSWKPSQGKVLLQGCTSVTDSTEIKGEILIHIKEAFGGGSGLEKFLDDIRENCCTRKVSLLGVAKESKEEC